MKKFKGLIALLLAGILTVPSAALAAGGRGAKTFVAPTNKGGIYGNVDRFLTTENRDAFITSATNSVTETNAFLGKVKQGLEAQTPPDSRLRLVEVAPGKYEYRETIKMKPEQLRKIIEGYERAVFPDRVDKKIAKEWSDVIKQYIDYNNQMSDIAGQERNPKLEKEYLDQLRKIMHNVDPSQLGMEGRKIQVSAGTNPNNDGDVNAAANVWNFGLGLMSGLKGMKTNDIIASMQMTAREQNISSRMKLKQIAAVPAVKAYYNDRIKEYLGSLAEEGKIPATLVEDPKYYEAIWNPDGATFTPMQSGHDFSGTNVWAGMIGIAKPVNGTDWKLLNAVDMLDIVNAQTHNSGVLETSVSYDEMIQYMYSGELVYSSSIGDLLRNAAKKFPELMKSSLPEEKKIAILQRAERMERELGIPQEQIINTEMSRMEGFGDISRAIANVGESVDDAQQSNPKWSFLDHERNNTINAAHKRFVNEELKDGDQYIDGVEAVDWHRDRARFDELWNDPTMVMIGNEGVGDGTFSVGKGRGIFVKQEVLMAKLGDLNTRYKRGIDMNQILGVGGTDASSKQLDVNYVGDARLFIKPIGFDVPVVPSIDDMKNFLGGTYVDLLDLFKRFNVRWEDFVNPNTGERLEDYLKRNKLSFEQWLKDYMQKNNMKTLKDFVDKELVNVVEVGVQFPGGDTGYEGKEGFNPSYEDFIKWLKKNGYYEMYQALEQGKGWEYIRSQPYIEQFKFIDLFLKMASGSDVVNVEHVVQVSVTDIRKGVVIAMKNIGYGGNVTHMFEMKGDNGIRGLAPGIGGRATFNFQSPGNYIITARERFCSTTVDATTYSRTETWRLSGSGAIIYQKTADGGLGSIGTVDGRKSDKNVVYSNKTTTAYEDRVAATWNWTVTEDDLANGGSNGSWGFWQQGNQKTGYWIGMQYNYEGLSGYYVFPGGWQLGNMTFYYTPGISGTWGMQNGGPQGQDQNTGGTFRVK